MKLKEFLFSNKYGSLRYKISYFFHSKIPFISPGWNTYCNPWYHWWKVRKYFKQPDSHFYCGKITWFFGLPCRHDYYNRILDIHFSALGWKDKWYTPRHEWDPYIAITIFRKWQLIWTFNWADENDNDSITRSMATWEAILDFSYYNKSMKWVVNNHIWGSGIGKDSHNIYITPNLTQEGQRKAVYES